MCVCAAENKSPFVDCLNISNTNARQPGISSRTYNHKTLENYNYCSLSLLHGRYVLSSLMWMESIVLTCFYYFITCICQHNCTRIPYSIQNKSTNWSDSTKVVKSVHKMNRTHSHLMYSMNEHNDGKSLQHELLSVLSCGVFVFFLTRIVIYNFPNANWIRRKVEVSWKLYATISDSPDNTNEKLNTTAWNSRLQQTLYVLNLFVVDLKLANVSRSFASTKFNSKLNANMFEKYFSLAGSMFAFNS